MSPLISEIQSWTICRRCANEGACNPCDPVEVVEKAELDALIRFTSAAIDLLPERHRKVIVADMKARLAE